MTALEEIKTPVEAEIERVVQSVNEWDDRTSPDDYPEHLLITSEELADTLRNFAETTLESLQRENEELRQDRDRTARNRDMYKGQVERQAVQIEDFRSETKRVQVGVYVETLPAVHLISVFADDMNELNWDDKRAYIKQQADRIRTALASTGGEHNAE